MQLLIATACFALLAFGWQEGEDPLIGKRAPEWEPDAWLRGGPVKLADLKDKVVLVRFFTNTCPFCAASMPALQAPHEKYRETGLVLIGFYHPKPFGVRRSRKSVERMLDRWKVTFPIALDTRWRTLKKYWLDTGTRRATSASFLIDGEGRFRYVHPGPELHPKSGNRGCNLRAGECNRHFEELETAIRALLGKK